ncbi:hypothetical protein TSAR_009598 [Trichomalopsis sarcophagae]|uniref:Odorant receptor n=1 Tax=Trichomalopsis sarcophagae TaxID=543379 RepID=A0A232F2X3_9HYME|nr:hypothetical protein TSAR_009598 [Trichomalopsis sarcophagae]
MGTRDKRLKVSMSTKTKGGFSYEFRIYKIITWPAGLWPLERDNIFNVLRFLLATSSQMFIVVTSLVEIYRKCGNVADVLDYYALSIAFWLSFMRLVLVRIHLAKVHKICYNARKTWARIKNPDLVKIMISHAKMGKRFYYLQMSIAFVIVMLYIFNPLILRRYDAANLPVQTVCTFNNVDALKHTSVYFIEIVSFLYLAVGFISIDLLFLGIAMHLCGQLRILQKEFSEIVGKSTSQADCIRYVISLSRRFQRVVELTDDIRKTFSEILLVNFVVNLFLITSQSTYIRMYSISLIYILSDFRFWPAGVTLLLALKINNYFLAVKCSQSFPILLIEMFLYCYVGELLRHAFDDIPRAVYSSHWYLLPPKIRRGYLLHVMAQASKTFDLTAGKMIRMNMSTFIQLVRSIVSFFSLLLLMFDK